MADAPKLKDYFTDAVVREIGETLAAHHPAFDVDRYLALVLDPADAAPFAELGFTERTRRIAASIDATAELEPVALFDLLVRALPPGLDGAEGALNDGFLLWPYSDVLATHGAQHPAEALAACYELTKCFTSEFAIRPVLAAHPETLATLAEWTNDPNEHVRRLVSEGTRPRLPWAARLSLPLDEVLPLLTALRADPSLYVRRSVANHLNDLAKDHPERIVALLATWHREAVAAGEEGTQWIVRHALRNHLKNGTPGALAIFGYEPPAVDVVDLTANPTSVAIGAEVTIDFGLRSSADADQLLMVDLVMGYVKANGTTSPKVFKYRELTLGADSVERCTKGFAMVVRSTRKLYPGDHSLTVRVNGVDLAETSFVLTG